MYKLKSFYLRENLPVVVFVIIVFISGVVFGAMGIKTVDYGLKSDLFEYFNGFIKGFDNLNFDSDTLMTQSIKFNLLNIVLIWISGVTVFLIPLIPFLIFLKGFVVGFTSSFLIHQYNLKGIILAFGAILPQNLVLIPAYIFAGVGGIYTAWQIIKYNQGKIRTLKPDIWNSFLLTFFWGIVVIIGALIEIYLSPVIMRFIFQYI